MINELMSTLTDVTPISSIEEMEAIVIRTYVKIERLIPGSALLIGGSAAFYKHYKNNLILMNDIDITFIHNAEIVRKLFTEAEELGLKKIRQTCIVVPMGVVDLHIDLDQQKCRKHFSSGLSFKIKHVRFYGKQAINFFYKRMNRPKDQEKIAIING